MNKFSLEYITANHAELVETHRDVVKECEAFCDMMTREPTFARLVEQCGRYISRLSNDDREDVLKIALELAWEFNGDLDPTKKSIVMWWDSFLQYAMNTRTHWLCRSRHGYVKVKTENVPLLAEAL